LEQRETDYRRNFATRRWFSKIRCGGFTESLNISVSAAIIIIQNDESIAGSTVSGIVENEIFRKAFWLRQVYKDIKQIEERYFEENPRW
jgi:tRNA (guanosine-2'-O-)-methyltransferase